MNVEYFLLFISSSLCESDEQDSPLFVLLPCFSTDKGFLVNAAISLAETSKKFGISKVGDVQQSLIYK